MKPIVIIDTNALYGLSKFSSSDLKEILALSKLDRIRLIVPEVVVHELSRQGAEDIDKKLTSLKNAHSAINKMVDYAGVIGLQLPHVVISADTHPSTTRSMLFDHMAMFLRSANAEIPAHPRNCVTDLLTRDLDQRKPFTETGNGFRDALIWQTVKEVIETVSVADQAVIFVTNNHRDFLSSPGGGLHPDLLDEIASAQEFSVVKDLNALLGHKLIEPLTADLRAVQADLTQDRIEKLVDDALSELTWQTLESTIGDYEGDGSVSVPLDTRLSDATFDVIMPNNKTIKHEVIWTGDPDELTVRVTVEGDCSIEGFIYKSEYLASSEDDSYDYVEEWNDHMMRATERHNILFTLSSGFTTATIQDIELIVEHAKEVAPATHPRTV